MKFAFAIGALALALCGNSAMAVASPDVLPQIGAADEAILDQMSDALFTNLRAGKTEIAVNRFFASSSLMQNKSADLQLLVSQTDGTFNIYGKLGICEKVETVAKGSMVEYRTYVCQHENMLTSWTLAYFKTSKGWIGAKMFFKDQPGQAE